MIMSGNEARNRNVFKRRRKVDRDGADITLSGTLCCQASDHTDIFVKRIEFYLNNTTNLRPLTLHVIPTKWQSYLGYRFRDVTSSYV